jgi:Phosphoglycerol transferase and related proteins, alkaline phosphatase superfamily
VRSIALRYGIFLVLFVGYTLFARSWAFNVDWTQWFTEIPFLVYLFALLQLPLRKKWWRFIPAIVPLMWLYAVNDTSIVLLSSVPNYIDVKLFQDVFQGLRFWPRVLYVTVLVHPLVIWLLSIDWKFPSFRWSSVALVLPFLLLTGSTIFFPTFTYESINAVTPDEEWSDKATAERWGRVYTMTMREIRRRSYLEGLEGYTPLAQSSIKLSDAMLKNLDKRNVHLVVLESFFDVRLLQGLKFSRPPVAEEFSAFADDAIGSSISPAFGGETSRAEFEVLCGVPSLRLYGVEFLGFSGAKTYCLPTILGNAGYFTLLSFPYGPIYYNTKHAYPGLGFSQILYADRFTKPGEESIALGDQTYLFDGDFFDQNLSKVKLLLQKGQPFLNYVLTMYGHYPFDIDTDRHPLLIAVQPDVDYLTRLANQMYYRTQALMNYINRLMEMDPQGIIVLVADHQPPMPKGVWEYPQFGFRSRTGLSGALDEFKRFENFLLIIADGKPQKLPLMRHFDIPRWILDRLTGGGYCREKICDFGRLPVDQKPYLDDYRTIMGLASRSAE